MRYFLKTVLLLAVFTFLPINSFAWNATGHMLVASIAYQQLEPKTREKVDGMVSYLHKEYPSINNFVDMACWLDQIRGQQIDTYTHWHYIDVAFSNDGTPLKNLIDTDNAIWATTHIETVVKNAHANPYERVRFLAFLTHVVGDLHQPLHTVSLISKLHPDGDKGGNAYIVYANNKKTNLHKIWDGGAFEFDNANPSEIQSLTLNITKQYSQNYFGKKALDLDPEHWAQEGLTLAKSSVYDTEENQSVNPAYLEKGSKIAEQQVALAGYRLANMLNQLLD